MTTLVTEDGIRQRALASLGKLPPFSPILSKLMAMLAKGSATFVELGDLIEKDTVVAANILRVVNSAAYARRDSVNSVRRALSILGVEKVRNTVLAISISRMLNQTKPPREWSMERFNRHAAAVAMLADITAQRVRVEYPEGAFAAGLLHDIGRLLIAMGLTEDYSVIRDLHQHSGRPWHDCEREVLGFDHAELSADAMSAWKLPAEIGDAIRFHHAPPAAPPLSLAQVLAAANEIVDAIGLSIEPAPGQNEPPLHVLQELGLSSGEAEALLAQFHREHDSIAQFFV